MTRRRNVFFIFLFFITSFFIVRESVAQKNLQVNVYGEILPPVACIINNKNTIKGDFGDLYPADFDGKKNKIELIIPLSCNERPTNNMKFFITGSPSSFDNNAVTAGRSDIGVKFFYLDKEVKLKSEYNFTYTNTIKIEALLIKNPNEKLVSGDFTATAFLNVDYL